MGKQPAILAALLAAGAVTAALASAAPANEPKKAIEPAAHARARNIAINVFDVPGTGWSAGPPSLSRARPRCSYYNPDLSKLTENGDSTTDYMREDGMFISSRVGIFVSAKQARAAYAAIVQPLFPRCLGASAARLSQPLGSVRVRSAGPLSFPRFGDRSAAFRIVYAFESGKSFARTALDIVVINRGDVEAVLFFGMVKGSVPASVERRIAGRMAARSASP
jgi:hypothetical protein